MGDTTAANYERLLNGDSAVQEHTFLEPGDRSFWVGAFPDINRSNNSTLFDDLCLRACREAIRHITLPPERTLLILSTTKGNIGLLGQDPGDPRLELHYSAQLLSRALNLPHYEVVSNACISGVLALIVAKRFITSGRYDHALVIGADVVSSFVLSGFGSLMALSNSRCKPFDKERTGINLGEAAAAIVLSADPASLGTSPVMTLSGEGVTNDANHISGPSRTGAELALALDRAMKTAGVTASDIDYVSAHGTATLFNDEMEAKAFNLIGLQSVPVNSLKSYYGHTLGAAGVLESVIALQSLRRNEVIATREFSTPGTSVSLNVAARTFSKQMNKIIKTASGFGGCNAAVVFEKINA